MENRDEQLRQKILEQIKDFRLIDDDFMTKVFEDKACTELLLRIILKRDDLTVKKVESQYTVKNLQGRSVRLDIYATDREGKAYNIEVQRSDAGAVAQRARYNSSLIDANITVPGENLENLPETYVIFITENDVLKGNIPLYHIERRIVETGELFDDGSHILYVNSQIQDGTELGRLMQDFYRRDAKEMNYDLLAERVYYLKQEEEGVTTMCRAVEKLCREERQAGMQAGMQAGERATKKALVIKMLGKGMTYEQIADISDLTVDEIKKIDSERK